MGPRPEKQSPEQSDVPSTGNVVVAVHTATSTSDSDVDLDDPSTQGYLPLDGSVVPDPDSMAEQQVVTNTTVAETSFMRRVVPDELSSIPHEPRVESLPADPGHLDQVKLCMAGFELPVENIPSWANELPEEDWRTHLQGRLLPNAQSHPTAKDEK